VPFGVRIGGLRILDLGVRRVQRTVSVRSCSALYVVWRIYGILYFSGLWCTGHVWLMVSVGFRTVLGGVVYYGILYFSGL
jgi:hypothetical protein